MQEYLLKNTKNISLKPRLSPGGETTVLAGVWSLVCGSGALSLCISKAFHRRAPQKAAEETRATKDIPQQPACHMSPVETPLGRKQREASLHDHLNTSSELIPSDADATVIRKHLGKRASADGSQQPQGPGGKDPVERHRVRVWFSHLAVLPPAGETGLGLPLFPEVLLSWLVQPEAQTTCLPSQRRPSTVSQERAT